MKDSNFPVWRGDILYREIKQVIAWSKEPKIVDPPHSDMVPRNLSDPDVGARSDRFVLPDFMV